MKQSILLNLLDLTGSKNDHFFTIERITSVFCLEPLQLIDVYLLYYDDLKKSRLYLNTVVLLTVLLCYVRKAEHKVIIASPVLLCCSRMF